MNDPRFGVIYERSLGELLERLALRVDAEDKSRDRSHEHEQSADEITEEHV